MTNEATRGEHGISIHIDGHQVFAPKELMTGNELRNLITPPIGPERDLYLEVHGQGQDHLVGDNEEVSLKHGMHFYSAPKTINPGE